MNDRILNLPFLPAWGVLTAQCRGSNRELGLGVEDIQDTTAAAAKELQWLFGNTQVLRAMDLSPYGPKAQLISALGYI